MSLKIDFSKPLTDYEKAYLRAWNKEHLIPVEDEEELPSESDEAEADEEAEPTSESDDELDDELPYSRIDYESWTVADLQAEIRDRNASRDEENELSLSGRKVDLIDRLVEDDRANTD